MAIEPAFLSRILDILRDWLSFRKVKKFLAKLLGKLKIRLRSANKPLKNADEEQRIRISRTSEVLSEHVESKHRQQKVNFSLHGEAQGDFVSRPLVVDRAESYRIQLLIESDFPPNSIRFHDVMECDRDFINRAMESRRFMSLDDLVKICMNSTPVTAQPNDRLESLKKIVGDIELVAENGQPSPLLLKLFREILFGISHLHDKLRMVHGCLNPESILIGLEGSFGELEKELLTFGCGNSDSLAPTQCENRRHLTWEEDMCALDKIFYYCITGRPFSERRKFYRSQSGWAMVECREVLCPEVLHLLSHLLNSNPTARPKAIELLQHPLFWNSEKRLSFLRDIRERLHDSQYSTLLKEIQKIAVKDISVGESWQEQIDDKIIGLMNKRLKQKSKYDYCSVRDLLRFIRNMMVHYGELPKHIQRSVGTLHKGFDSYFTSRFPKLLIEVYKVVCGCCKEDEQFCRYFNGGRC